MLVRIAGVLAITFLPVGIAAHASDHADGPRAAGHRAADLGDLYAWRSGDDLVAILTLGGSSPPGQVGAYDANVLYTLHIDNDLDNQSDIDVHVRFGTKGNEWGVQILNLPGAPDTLVGPVDEAIDAGDGRQVLAGVRDDPYFFDREGWEESLATGTLALDRFRDSVAGLNATAIVMEMDLEAARSGGTRLNLWATSGRK